MSLEESATDPAEQQEGNGSNGRRTPRVRVFSKYVLPSDRHPFQLHFEVLKRMVVRTRNGQEAVEAAKAEGEGVPVQAAQMNVRFMKDIGLLKTTDRGLYLPTPETIKFVNARSVDDNRAKPILVGLLAKTWFAEVAVNQFRLDPIMSEDRFIGELALAAETDKAKKEAALRVILEYLVYSGILNRDERGLSLGNALSPEDGMAFDASTTGPTEAAVAPAVAGLRQDPGPTLGNPTRLDAGPEWKVLQSEVFHVKVRASMDAVEELMDHLEILKKSIQRRQAKATPPTPEETAQTP